MEPTVTREVTVDAPVEEVWTAITDEEARSAWLGEDGSDRTIEVEHRVERERITWSWWGPEDGPDAASRVTITLSPHPDGSTGVRVVEELGAGAGPRARASCASPVRAAWATRMLDLELWLLLALQRV